VGNVYKILVGKLDGNIPFERPQHRWDSIVRMYHKGKLWAEFIWLRIGTSGRLL
jgi:hypothetical protein